MVAAACVCAGCFSGSGVEAVSGDAGFGSSTGGVCVPGAEEPSPDSRLCKVLIMFSRALGSEGAG